MSEMRVDDGFGEVGVDDPRGKFIRDIDGELVYALPATIKDDYGNECNVISFGWGDDPGHKPNIVYRNLDRLKAAGAEMNVDIKAV